MTATSIKGRKGGSGGGSTPTESPDDLQSNDVAKILVALGNGEWLGGLSGSNIFLDGTDIDSLGGNIKWDFRPGTQHQTYIQGTPDVQNGINIDAEIKSNVNWVRSISNTQLDAVRLTFNWPALQEQKTNGDVVGYRIEYAIDLATDGGAFQQILSTAVDGKTTTTYQRAHRITLPRAATGWQVRVRRLTANANSARIADTMKLGMLTEVIDAKLRYPNTALLYVEFDAKQFPNRIPQITCKPKMAIIRVPDNYDPIARTYTGTWLGNFKWAWSNNPAWVFYDIVTSQMYGLGHRIDATQIDRYELYRIAQYCDQLVPDGRGGTGMEPRFLCDIYIQSQEEAWTVLTDLAGIFRGMTYWGDNQMVALSDMPRDIDYTYTRASVLNGKFNYSSGSERVRYSNAMVGYSNPINHYADDVEPVPEPELVKRYGFNPLDLTAIGCTRQSEANRRGRWALLSNAKDSIVTFSVGLDGHLSPPGRIIAVADPRRAGRAMGGRISEVSGRNIKLDRVADVKPNDRLLINLPSGKSQARTVQAVVGEVVTVTAAYSEVPEAQTVWAIDADDLFVQQYRVTSLTDNGDNTFTISAVFHDPDKYARIDTGARIEDRPISVIPPGVQAPPTGIAISSFTSVSQGIAVTTMHAQWNAPDNAVAYEAQWRKDNGNWISIPRTSATSFDITGIYAGRYLVRVRAINSSDISSVWASSIETALSGKEGAPTKPIGFMASDNVVFGVELNWGFSENTGDTLKTEIQYSPAADGSNAILLADVPYPQRNYQQLGLRAGQKFWYRAQLVDKTGNESGYTDWVMGQASSDAEAILSYLTGEINETQLAQDLLTKINNAITEEELAGVRSEIGETKGRLGSLAEGVLNSVIAIKDNDELIRELSAQTGQNVATIYQKLQVLTTADSAFAQQMDVIGARVTDNSAAITTEQTARVEGDLALASRITLLDASVGGNNAAILAEQTARVEGDSANAKAVNDLSAKVGDNTANITTLNEAFSDISGSIATQLQGVNASNHNNAEANLFQAVSEVLADASVTSLKKVVANNDIASAQKIETLTAQINDTKAQVQQTAQAVVTVNNKIDVSYSVKLGVTSGGAYVATGFAIGLSNESGTLQSQFLVSADRFAILPSSNNGTVSSAVSPFIADGGQVFMNSAVIKDGFINNAMIGNFIQSNGYSSSGTGWNLDKDSGFTFKSSVPGEGSCTLDARGLRTYDSAGNWTVKIGSMN